MHPTVRPTKTPERIRRSVIIVETKEEAEEIIEELHVSLRFAPCLRRPVFEEDHDGAVGEVVPQSPLGEEERVLGLENGDLVPGDSADPSHFVDCGNGVVRPRERRCPAGLPEPRHPLLAELETERRAERLPERGESGRRNGAQSVFHLFPVSVRRRRDHGFKDIGAEGGGADREQEHQRKNRTL